MYFFALDYVLSSNINAVLYPQAVVTYLPTYDPVPMIINEYVTGDQTGSVSWASNAIGVKDYPPNTIQYIDFYVLFKSAGNSDTIENLFSYATAILKYEDETIYKAQNIIAINPSGSAGQSEFPIFMCVRLEG